MAALYLGVLVIPGPSVLLVAQSSILQAKQQGIYTALGITSGIAIQLFLILLGLSFLQEGSLLFIVLQLLSTTFLAYLGIANIATALRKQQPNKTQINSTSTSFLKGLLVEILNPLAFVFFTSLFALHVSNINVLTALCYWAVLVIIGGVFFMGVAQIAHSPWFYGMLEKRKKTIHVLSGSLLLLFSVQSFLSLDLQVVLQSMQM